MDMIKLEDLRKAPEDIEHISTIDIQGYVSLAFCGEIMVAVSPKGAYFIDINTPYCPVVRSYVGLRKESIGQYSNGFIGIHNTFAFFRIGYDGIEIVDIANISNPVSHCFVPHEKSRIGNFDIVKNGLGLNRWGIFDISYVCDFKCLLSFDEPIDNTIICGDYVYYFHKNIVKAVSLYEPIKILDVFEFEQELIYTKQIKDGLCVVVAKRDVYVIQLSGDSPFVHVSSGISYNTKIYSIWPNAKGYVAVLPPVFRQRFEKVSLENPDRPRSLYTIEAWPAYSILSGKNFVAISHLKGKHSMDEMVSPTISVIKTATEGNPELIAEINDHRYSGCYCLDDLIYYRHEDGVRIYRVGLPQR